MLLHTKSPTFGAQICAGLLCMHEAAELIPVPSNILLCFADDPRSRRFGPNVLTRWQ